MKVIFLDFDGVLNSWDFVRRVPQSGVIGIDEEAVTRVWSICRDTGARIVVSSSWRLIHTLNDIRGILGGKGLPRGWVIGRTPSERTLEGERWPFACRGDEIQAWLDKHSVDSFVILDDDSDMGHLKHRLIQTEFSWGLRQEHVEKAMEMLR